MQFHFPLQQGPSFAMLRLRERDGQRRSSDQTRGGQCGCAGRARIGARPGQGDAVRERPPSVPREPRRTRRAAAKCSRRYGRAMHFPRLPRRASNRIGRRRSCLCGRRERGKSVGESRVPDARGFRPSTGITPGRGCTNQAVVTQLRESAVQDCPGSPSTSALALIKIATNAPPFYPQTGVVCRQHRAPWRRARSQPVDGAEL